MKTLPLHKVAKIVVAYDIKFHQSQDGVFVEYNDGDYYVNTSENGQYFADEDQAWEWVWGQIKKNASDSQRDELIDIIGSA